MRMVDEGGGVIGGIDLATARKLAVRIPQAEIRFDSEILARLAWESNGANRMAFEFLTAERLFRRDSRAVLNDLDGFRKLGYDELPRLVQECVLSVASPADVGQGSMGAGWLCRELTRRRAGSKSGLSRSACCRAFSAPGESPNCLRA